MEVKRSFLFCLAMCLPVYSQYITLDIPMDNSLDAAHQHYITKKYYFVTYFKANFFRAHQYCRYNGMELLTIDSKEEEALFLNLLNNKDFEFKKAKNFWTSGTDLGEEGKFFFLSNGKDVGQLSWANNEPNNGKKSESNETENCMAFMSTDTLKFYRLFDTFCSLQSSFVCQNIQSNPQINRYKRSVKSK